MVSNPLVYDLVQNLAGQARVAERLEQALSRLPHDRTLDVGSATGGFALRLGVDPVLLDNDLRPLLAVRRRALATRAVAADGALLPFPSRSFNVTLCVAVSHHLEDETLPRLVSELSRVTSGHLLFLDPVRNDSRWISRWLWRYDRGRHPRARSELLAILERAFNLVEIVDFAVYHQYLLCVASPRRRNTD